MSIFTLYYIIPFLATITAIFIVAAIHYTFFYETKPTLYSSESPLLPNQLVGRDKEIRRLTRQIMTGQSSAIIGPFSAERTSILEALNNPERYGDKADRLIFSYLDISSLDKDCSQAQFWEDALKPLQVQMGDDTSSALSKVYQDCQNHQFDNFYLNRVFEQLKKDNLRLVLMLDRFDLLLHQDNLNRSDFFGNLRTRASHYPSPLSLIITLNNSLHQFHQDTTTLNPLGSPYLNFLEAGVMTLGALSETEIDELLHQRERFTEEDCDFIKEIAGGHPYLLQMAATILWEAYDNDEENPIESARKTFPDRVESLLNNILQTWSKNTCKAFLSVAQKHDVSGFKTELEELEKQGFIVEDNNGAWRVRASVFLSFLKDKTE